MLRFVSTATNMGATASASSARCASGTAMCSASSAALSSATFFADADLVPAIVSAVVRDRIVPRDVPRSRICLGSNEAAPGAARLDTSQRKSENWVPSSAEDSTPPPG